MLALKKDADRRLENVVLPKSAAGKLDGENDKREPTG